MTIASGNFPELLWPGIREIWGKTYDQYEVMYPKIFTVKTSDKRFEKEQGITTMPLAGLKDEGNQIPYSDFYQGYQKEYVNVTYALGASVTREMYEDDQYSVINEIPRLLAESLQRTKETLAFNHLNRAFNASYTGADGATLISTTHTNVADGANQSNQLTTASDLTQTAVESLNTQIMNWDDDQGLPIRVMPRCLVVHPNDNFTARKILETANEVGTANNTVNPIKGLFSDLVVSPYLTDTDAWFIVTDIRNGLTWNDRRASELVRDNEFDTQNLKFATTWRGSSGWTDWRGIAGTPGA